VEVLPDAVHRIGIEARTPRWKSSWP
jgi:hypothetical protein